MSLSELRLSKWLRSEQNGGIVSDAVMLWYLIMCRQFALSTKISLSVSVRLVRLNLQHSCSNDSINACRVVASSGASLRGTALGIG